MTTTTATATTATAAAPRPGTALPGHRVTEDFAVRIAGLPAAVLNTFGLRTTPGALRDHLTCGAEAEAAADAAGDALHTVIGALAGTPAKPLAVALRRAVHRGDATAAATLLGRLGDRIPPAVAGLVTAWSALARRGREQLAALDALVAAEAGEEVRRMLTACADTDFRRGVAHASPSVARALEAWLAGPGSSVPPRKLTGALTRYLTRAAAKTSPYSTFTGCGLGRLVPGGPAFESAGGSPRVEVAELNLWTLSAVAGVLLGRPANRDLLPVRVNPSALAIGRTVLAVGRGLRQESVVELPLTPAVRRCLDLVRQEPLTLAGLRERLTALGAGPGDGDGDPASVRAFLERLLEAGVLQTPTPLTDQHPDHLGALTSWARQCPDADERTWRALSGLSDTLAEYGEARRPAVQTALRAGAYRQLKDLADSLAPAAVPVPLTDAFFHNVLSAGRAATADVRQWGPVLDELDLLRRFMALFDLGLAARLAVRAYLTARYPAGESVPFVLLCRDLFADAARPGDTEPGGPEAGSPEADRGSPAPEHLRLRLLARHAVALLADPGPSGLADSPVAQVRELEQVRRRTLAELHEAPPGDDGVVRPDPARLERMIAGWPAFVRAPRSVSVYGQPGEIGGAPHLVVNMLATGWGRAANRVHRQLADAGRGAGPGATAPPAGDGAAVPVEVRAAFGHSGSLRHPATSFAIDYPATAGDRPPEASIPLADLLVRHDGSPDSVVMRSAARGFAVLPVHLGLMAPTLLPPVMRLLLAFGESALVSFAKQNPLAPAHPDAARPHGIHLPRLALPHVTVQRACWLFSGEDVPRPAPADPPAAHLLRIARWRAEHGLPRQCFARVLPRNLGADRANPMQKSRKPFYLDFSSPLLLDSFDRALGAADDLVVLEEAWPSPALLGAADPASARVTEIVLELTERCEEGGTR
ncbi:lantibiotic dehydratase [Kitasatospora sp. NPDC049258]|uniref:lantibiotic dehydratase n=1 Tax=Kitasatospora sp. NPDC049258 TaxID=3155394 RepID=UPI00343C2B20